MATKIEPEAVREDCVLGEEGTALRCLVRDYVAELPDPQAVQSLLVVGDVLTALGWSAAQIREGVGVAAEACMRLLAGAQGEEG